MRTVYLHGILGERFGQEHRFDADSAESIVMALLVNFPDFRDVFRKESVSFVHGSTSPFICISDLKAILPADDPVHIIPVVSGSIPVPAALIGAIGSLTGGAFSAATIGTALAFVGNTIISMALSYGLSMLLSKPPDIGGYDSRESKKSSFLFNGAINRTEQGGPVPVPYGKIMVGSVLISGGVEVEEIVKNG